MVTTILSCDRTKNVERQSVERQKLNYELRERCGKVGKQTYIDDYSWFLMGDYQCHYNPHLNRCFLLITTQDDQGIKSQYLIDVNEHKESLFSFRTEHGGRGVIETKACNDVNDWYAYVNRMMEQ
jgi:hypothetical protein